MIYQLKMNIIDPKGLAQVIRALVLVAFSSRSKVRIPLGANNSLGSAPRLRQSIIRSVWMGRFVRVRGYPKSG
jgi:hypothetical protein